MFIIEEELKKLPAKPGVYIMHNSKDDIIYVGKAKILKNRVKQYFQNGRNLSPKIQRMVSFVAYFEYIVVDSEMEALILECNLIKEHHPRFNTMLMDDKGYPYIKITVQEPYPKVLFAHDKKKDKARYFGPYTSAQAVKNTIDLLRKLYCIRTCSKKLPKPPGPDNQPCLYYHMNQCKAPCQGYISEDEYQKSIDGVIAFLNGNYDAVLKELISKMKEASESMEFEAAAGFRDLINDIRKITQKQKATDADDATDRDIIAYARNEKEAVVQVFFIRDGKMLGREHYYLQGVESDNGSDILSDFIKQYYSGTPYIPRELLLSEQIEEEALLTEWMTAKRGQKVYIKVPKIGTKERLIELARKNAEIVLQQDAEKLEREVARTSGAMDGLGRCLSMENLKRIESFDISNTSGFSSVGSMVVYENGKPKRNDYRKFKIKSVQGPDDYASMREVLTRRFLHGIEEQKELEEKGMNKEVGGFTRYPDLILMDGGKGQVNIALEVLSELKLSIEVCGMVKDDHHRTRGLYYKNNEIPIDPHSETFQLITRIQDETHRFAIEYHKALRGKGQVHSVLDDIAGVGTTRRRALMKHYMSLESIRAASIEELSVIPGMNKAAAQSVHAFFHPAQ